jgi:hypothetical protein
MVLDKALFRRVFQVQAVLVVLGLIGFSLSRGRVGGMSFLVGATLGTLSLWVLFRVVGMAETTKVTPLTLLLISTRLLIAGLILYVILRTYEVHLGAAASGVLSHIVAIILATLYDYFHARTP